MSVHVLFDLSRFVIGEIAGMVTQGCQKWCYSIGYVSLPIIELSLSYVVHLCWLFPN